MYDDGGGRIDGRVTSVAAVAELEVAAPHGLVHTLSLQLDGLDVGTLRMQRLTAALALLQTLTPLNATWGKRCWGRA